MSAMERRPEGLGCAEAEVQVPSVNDSESWETAREVGTDVTSVQESFGRH